MIKKFLLSLSLLLAGNSYSNGSIDLPKALKQYKQESKYITPENLPRLNDQIEKALFGVSLIAFGLILKQRAPAKKICFFKDGPKIPIYAVTILIGTYMTFFL